MKEIEKRAAALIARCENVTLCSITEKGYPRPCLVSKLKAFGFHTFFISTTKNSRKTLHFQKNPRAGASFSLDGDSVTMTGAVTIHTDEKTLSACWQDWMQKHFPGGKTDPDYCVLQFTAEEATFYIGGEFLTFHYPQVDSRCGIECSKKDCKKEFGFDCKGCAKEPDAPWGRCPVKECCEGKGLFHCGECEEFPCKLLNSFAYDKENGDGGKRLEICRCWQREVKKI